MSNLTQSFQCPNEYVDEFCAQLNSTEFKILIILVRKIFGWNKTSDRVSYEQLMSLTGIRDRNTIARGLKKLCELKLIEKAGKNHIGQEYKLGRFLKKPGQITLFRDVDNSESRMENPTTRKARSYGKTLLRSYGKADTQNTLTKPTINTRMSTPERTPIKKALKKQLEMNFTEPKEVVAHLREIASNGSEEKEAAGISLMVLEQLWNWHNDKKKANEEFMKSWQWLFYAAEMWPTIVARAWGEVKSRKLEGENMKKPGAILTLRIKELTDENQQHQNQQGRN